MVLTRRVGKERSFWAGLALVVVTLGVYAYYWLYKVHDEVFKQYELDREGRDEGVVWLILGLLLPILILVYLWKFAENVNYVRARMRLPARMTPLKFVGLHVGAMVTFFVGALVAMAVALAGGVAFAEGGASEAETGGAFVGVFFTVYALSALAAVVVLALAYRGMQRDVNETWAWYDAHVDAFTAPRPPGTLPDSATDPSGSFDPPV